MVAINPLSSSTAGAEAAPAGSTSVEQGFAAQLAAANAGHASSTSEGGSNAVAAEQHGSGPPAPPSAPADGATGVDGTAQPGESKGAAMMRSIGLGPSMAKIIKRARSFVPEGSSLQIFSTQHGRFQARFFTDPSDAASFQPPPPAGQAGIPGGGAGGLLPPPPPPAPTFGGSGSIGGPPAPPLIPPDEIVLATEPSEEESDGPPAPPGLTSTIPAPVQSSVVSAYQSAVDGEINFIAAAARIPDEAIDEQA